MIDVQQPNRSSRAFIVEPTGFDTSGASRFGTLEYLFNENAARPSVFTAEFQTVVLNELDRRAYDPLRDFVVVSGAIVTLTVVTSLITAEYGCIKLLCWDMREQQYVPIDVGEPVPSET